MRLVFASVLLLTANLVYGASIPMMEFPVKNGQMGEVYKMSEHPNSVFVFESYKLSCVYCNNNAHNVDALATYYKNNARVQVLDAGLDAIDSAYAEWISRHKPNHTVVQDVGGKLFKALRSDNYIPQVFVVNCKGELVYSTIGEWDSSVVTAIHESVDQALATECPTN